jgi:hypothetical protein
VILVRLLLAEVLAVEEDADVIVEETRNT